MKIISRTSNRTFVGDPLCRDPEFAALNFTIDVVMGSAILSLLADLFKPIAGRLSTNVPNAIRNALRHLKPIIDERMQN
ncbi:hypothetical protein JB92DRAFT_569634 [Gautieria morchelliformis]|nr:hypothetical protein JB92DRAFT_569634 [Gautieria morchelliformis]